MSSSEQQDGLERSSQTDPSQSANLNILTAQSTRPNQDPASAITPIPLLRSRRGNLRKTREIVPDNTTNIDLIELIVSSDVSPSEWPENLEGIDCANAERTAAGLLH